ncbi:MAG: hydroxysqualene dehydroxylase HpnE [Planctomycetaceae bacterium]|nr:hydroxysqualene dehydroxylase HpnE [Planctomycetaceae bacterium]
MSEAQKTLGIIGGGLAGITAAETAVTQGCRVNLFERSGILGGRVASLFEPTQKQWIDTGQHLFLGCCTAVRSLNDRLGLAPFFERTDVIPFATVKQQHWTLSASSFLPKRWQLLPSFLAMPMLPFGERLKTGKLLRKLGSEPLPDITIDDWFKQHRVSQNALNAFWLPLVLSTLSELPDYISAKAVQRVIRDGFLAGREGMSIHLPTAPLRSIYHDAASAALAERGVSLNFFKRLRRLHWDKTNPDEPPTIVALEFSDNSVEEFDRYILAMPAFQLWKVLEASDLACYAEQLGLERFEPGAITTVHLWLNQPVLKPGKRFCALSGGIGQFLCVPSDADSNYCTVVISASHRLLPETEMTMSGCQDLAAVLVEQLRMTFGISTLELLHCRTTTSFDAIFSPKPEIFAERPEAKGLFANGTIAGDWTQTGFPATMEGAVRSGLTAVEALKVF